MASKHKGIKPQQAKPVTLADLVDEIAEQALKLVELSKPHQLPPPVVAQPTEVAVGGGVFETVAGPLEMIAPPNNPTIGFDIAVNLVLKIKEAYE
jgi:hypothetical protein